MARDWKSWLASASLLLLVGAGCAGSADQKASMEAGMKAEDGASLEVTVDANVDAALAEVESSTKSELDENSDTEIVTGDSSELNAYGNAYAESEL